MVTVSLALAGCVVGYGPPRHHEHREGPVYAPPPRPYHPHERGQRQPPIRRQPVQAPRGHGREQPAVRRDDKRNDRDRHGDRRGRQQDDKRQDRR